MAEFSFPFNSIGGDRRYKAEEFRQYFALLMCNGIFYRSSDALKVVQGEGMTVQLKAGAAWADGCGYVNTKPIPFTLDTADGALNRIDRVVLRCNYKERRYYAAVKKGTPSAQPTAPGIQRDADAYEQAVADIYVGKGTISITQANITDTRLNTELCGIVTGTVQQADTTDIFNQFEAYYEQFKAKYTADVIQMMDKADRDIAEYIAELKTKGDANLAAIIEQLIAFRNENEAEFLAWFEDIKGILSGDQAGALLLKINDLTQQVEELQAMLLAGMIHARLLTGQGDYITDDKGNPLLMQRPICQCQAV